MLKESELCLRMTLLPPGLDSSLISCRLERLFLSSTSVVSLLTVPLHTAPPLLPKGLSLSTPEQQYFSSKSNLLLLVDLSRHTLLRLQHHCGVEQMCPVRSCGVYHVLRLWPHHFSCLLPENGRLFFHFVGSVWLTSPCFFFRLLVLYCLIPRGFHTLTWFGVKEWSGFSRCVMDESDCFWEQVKETTSTSSLLTLINFSKTVMGKQQKGVFSESGALKKMGFWWWE